MTNETNVLSYQNATGPVPYGLKNDYMFHVVFQENMEALKGLVASVLHIPEESMTILTKARIISKPCLPYISVFLTLPYSKIRLNYAQNIWS